MKSKFKHTPAPWRYSESHDDIISMANIKEDIVMLDAKVHMSEANAHHIVKCVNIHDDLVEALSFLCDNRFDELPRDEKITRIYRAKKVLKKARSGNNE